MHLIMKNLCLIFLFLNFSSSDIYTEEIFSHSEHQNIKENSKIRFYAYLNVDVDSFNSQCILCTASKDYVATIAFTEHWKITLWKNQAYLGRALIIPKRHFGSYEEMTDEEAIEYREILRYFLPALKKTFGATYFNVAYLMNQAYRYENSDPPQKDGQPNPHFHWHIIPRYNEPRTFKDQLFEDPDFGNSFDFTRKQYVTSDFQKEAIDAIRENLGVVYLKK
jgi:diadenosine tetraphosphate (Ap4A) HIT family hydrolase